MVWLQVATLYQELAHTFSHTPLLNYSSFFFSFFFAGNKEDFLPVDLDQELSRTRRYFENVQRFYGVEWGKVDKDISPFHMCGGLLLPLLGPQVFILWMVPPGLLGWPKYSEDTRHRLAFAGATMAKCKMLVLLLAVSCISTFFVQVTKAQNAATIHHVQGTSLWNALFVSLEFLFYLHYTCSPKGFTIYFIHKQIPMLGNY